jgi:hypothetical protein
MPDLRGLVLAGNVAARGPLRACFSDRQAACWLVAFDVLPGPCGMVSSGHRTGELAQARLACGSGWRLPLGGDGVGVGVG